MGQHEQDAFDRARRLLCQSRSIVITTHLHPDGDGIGSALALWHYLQAQGKETLIVLHSPVPVPLQFLPGAGAIQRYSEGEHAERITAADGIILVDTGELQRLGVLSRPVAEAPAWKLVIDHHLEPQPFADLYIVDHRACATGEIVWRFLKWMGGPYQRQEIALALYTAVMTDTGGFAHSQVSADVHRMVAELVELGVDIPYVHERVFQSWSLARMRLLG
ncbi:MAG: DHH family phosphoesterase, partial [Candidatus Kapabacteria bacterium]|nr:DHH family phosphoesterase [Candidatus Kapabacteria bacterium]